MRRGPELRRLYDEHAQPLFAFLLNLTRDKAVRAPRKVAAVSFGECLATYSGVMPCK